MCMEYACTVATVLFRQSCAFISADKSKEKSQEEELQKFRTGKMYFFLQRLDGHKLPIRSS